MKTSTPSLKAVIRMGYDVLQLKHLEHTYRLEKNPRHAFKAYTLARKRDYEVPTWVRGYFDKAFSTSPAREERVLESLGLRSQSRGNVYNRFRRESAKEAALCIVAGLLEKELETSLASACETASRIIHKEMNYEFSTSNIEAWYRAAIN